MHHRSIFESTRAAPDATSDRRARGAARGWTRRPDRVLEIIATALLLPIFAYAGEAAAESGDAIEQAIETGGRGTGVLADSEPGTATTAPETGDDGDLATPEPASAQERDNEAKPEAAEAEGAGASAPAAIVERVEPVEAPQVEPDSGPPPMSEAEVVRAIPTHTHPDVAAWRERVDILLMGMAAEQQDRRDADALYWELERELWPFHRAVKWDIERDTSHFIEDGTALGDLYAQRLRLIPQLSRKLYREVTGGGQIGRAELRKELSYLDTTLREQLRTIQSGLRQITSNLNESPITTGWITLQIALVVVLFRIWRRWSKDGLMQMRQRVLSIRPRQPTYLRLARVLWYLNRIGGPLSWLLLVMAISSVLNPRGFEELAGLIYTVLIWIIVARLAVQYIDAVAARGVGGLNRERAALRLRSLRLVAGWAVLLGLGINLVTRYAGTGVIHAWFIRACQLLSISVAVLLIRWWREEIRERLEEISDRSEWVRKLAAPRQGLVSYTFAILGVGQLIWIGFLKWLVRTLSGWDAGRRVLAVLVRREVARDIAREHEDDSEPVAEEVVTRLLEARDVRLDAVTNDQLSSLAGSTAARGGGGFVVLAERGGGKTVFVQRLAEQLGERMCVVQCPAGGYEAFEARMAETLGLDPNGDLSESLPAAIAASKIEIVGVDDAHRLARPWMGGQQGLDRLAELDTRTGGRIAWVLMMDRRSWPYIVLSRAERTLLQQVIELPSWSEEDLAELVQSRAKAAGVELDYRDLVLPRQLDAGEHENAVERNRYGYARILWELADGNPEVALRLFANSLRAHPDGRLFLRLPQPIFSSALTEAIVETLLVLRVLVQCDIADLDDITKSLRISESRARASLRYCNLNGWIDPVEGGWRIGWKYFRTITRALVRQNLMPR
jgi:hypothetical protein